MLHFHTEIFPKILWQLKKADLRVINTDILKVASPEKKDLKETLTIY